MTVTPITTGTMFGAGTATGATLSRMVNRGLYTGAVTYDAATNAVVRNDGSTWLADGFVEGQRVRITTGPNAGDYKVALIDGPAGAYGTVMHLTLERAIVAGAGGIVTVTQLAAAVTFTAGNFYTAQTVTLAADPFFDVPSFRENVKPFPVLPHLLTRLRGPLVVEGGVTGADRTLQPALKLPGELDGPLLGIAPPPPENLQIDTLNVFDDSSQEHKAGELTATAISGLGMAGPLTLGSGGMFGEPETVAGGISYGVVRVDPLTGVISTDSSTTTIEVLNLLLGKGNDRLTVTSTMVPGIDASTGVVANHGGITTVHGGGNSLLAVKGTFDLAGSSVTRTDGVSWASAGFAPGQLVTISGVAGTFTVVSITGATLVLSASTGNAAGVAATVAVLDPKTATTRIGGDTIVVTGGPSTLAAGGPASPLVIYGDTSQDGLWYSGLPADPTAVDFGPKPFDQVGSADDRFYFPVAFPYVYAGHDVIDARPRLLGLGGRCVAERRHHRLRRRGRRHDHRLPDRRPPGRRIRRRPDPRPARHRPHLRRLRGHRRRAHPHAVRPDRQHERQRPGRRDDRRRGRAPRRGRRQPGRRSR